jgi:protocatechuate 3,4-dioxygenase beta subunit
MFIKSLQIGLMGFLLCAANAWAGPASIQGIVKDAKGQPIKGADVRIESRDGKQLFNTVRTDTKGRYISEGLQPGVLPGFAGSQWCSEGRHWQHGNQVRSGNATEL